MTVLTVAAPLPELPPLSEMMVVTETVPVTADRSTWPDWLLEVMAGMECGLTYRRAVNATAGRHTGSDGKPMDTGVLRREMRRVCREVPEVEAEVRQLEAERAEEWLDEVVEIADDTNESVADRKLRIDTRIEVAKMRVSERYKPFAGQQREAGGVTINILRLSDTWKTPASTEPLGPPPPPLPSMADEAEDIAYTVPSAQPAVPSWVARAAAARAAARTDEDA